MGTITGFLTDVGMKPLTGRMPRLYLQLDDPAAFGVNLLVTAKYPARIDDATGAFTFENVVGSDEMLPERRYTLVADWDAGDQLDVMSGLFIPAAGGNLLDIINANGAARPGSIMHGFGPPPEGLTNVLYIDISGVDPVLYAPENGRVA